MNLNQFYNSSNFSQTYKDETGTPAIIQLFSKFVGRSGTIAAGKRTVLILASIAGMKNVTILLADDDEDDRELFEEAVAESKADVTVDMVEDGQKLMGRLLKTDMRLPDLIFIDLNMPCKDGKECLEEIRAHQKLKNIPVIIFSTSASARDIDDTYNKGANLYIRKPTSLKELITITKKVFELDWKKHTPKSNKQQFVLSLK